VKNILDEIRTENRAMIPDGQRQRGGKEKDVFCTGGFRGFKD
jgi:hypothetical protein